MNSIQSANNQLLAVSSRINKFLYSDGEPLDPLELNDAIQLACNAMSFLESIRKASGRGQMIESLAELKESDISRILTEANNEAIEFHA